MNTKRQVIWQLFAFLVVCGLMYRFSGWMGIISAVAGILIVQFGVLAALLSMRRSNSEKSGTDLDAGKILITLLKAEAIKIMVIVASLSFTFKVFASHIVPLALICGVALSAMMSGLGVMRFGKEDSTEKLQGLLRNGK